jgi:molybdopterin-guanine dinucleotide biosynthesis protein A
MDGLDGIKSKVTGFILAGGKSERLGRDKRKITVSGKTLMEKTIDLMEDFLDSHPFVLGDNLDGFNIPPEFIIGDAKKESGPLGGLVAALERCVTEWALVLAVDLPNITVEDLKQLLSSADDSFDIITLSVGELPEPLIALYRKQTESFWRGNLDRNLLSLSDGFKSLKYKKVFPAGGTESLRNINSLQDLEFENDRKDS